MENWNNLSVLIDVEHSKANARKDNIKKLVDACEKGDKAEVKELLKTGIPLNGSYANISPLNACINYGFIDLAKYLVKVGANINYNIENTYEDAMWFAVKTDAYEFIEYFVTKNCYLEKNGDGDTLLIWATKAGNLKTVQLLLKHKLLKINERDKLGNTALHHNAVKKSPTSDDIMIGKLLLAAGADKSAINFDSQTPEELANTQLQELMNEEEIKQEITNDPNIVLKNNHQKKIKI